MARSTKLPLEPPPEVIIPEERLQHILHKSFEPNKQIVGYNVRSEHHSRQTPVTYGNHHPQPSNNLESAGGGQACISAALKVRNTGDISEERNRA